MAVTVHESSDSDVILVADSSFSGAAWDGDFPYGPAGFFNDDFDRLNNDCWEALAEEASRCSGRKAKCYARCDGCSLYQVCGSLPDR